MSTRSMASKRIRLAPISDKKLIILTKKSITTTSMIGKTNENGEEIVEEEIVEPMPIMDLDNDVELPQ